MSLYYDLGFLKLKREPAYSASGGVLQAGSGVIFPQVRPKPRAKQRGGEVLLFGAIVAFFIFSLSAFLISFPQGTLKDRPAVAAAAPIVEAASGGKPSLEVHIANNGLVFLRAAKVVSIDGTTLTVSTAWGSSNFVWTVRTSASSYGTRSFGTRFIDLSGNPVAIDSIRTGDLVTATGMLDSNAKEPALSADMVRILK